MDKEKLLIVDDEVEFASTLCERLRLRGIDTTDVHSGSEGLKTLAEIAPNIVILDLEMPDMNGIDVLARIKKHDPDIQVIMLTGHGSKPANILAMEKGAIDYIMKPFDINELLEKINFAYEKYKTT